MININNSVKSIFFGNNTTVNKPNSTVENEKSVEKITKASFSENNNDSFVKQKKVEQIEETADAFVKENKDLATERKANKIPQSSILKRKMAKMDNKKVYKQINKDIDIKAMSEGLKSRIIAFPFVLKGIMALIPTYLGQKMDADTFSQVYLERTPHLFTRLDYGNDKEAFAKDFENEIAMVKSVNVACDDYQNGNAEQCKLDATIEENLEEYLKTPENKDILYIE